jgi:hypothetical protein
MKRRWPIAAVSVLALLAYAVWSALLWLLLALGTCGEDSDLDEDEYPRLCGDDAGILDGEVFRDFAVLFAVAGVAGVTLSVVAVRRRSWRVVIALVALLLVAGVSGFEMV